MEGRPSARSKASQQAPKPCPDPDPSCGGCPDSGQRGSRHSHDRCRQMGKDKLTNSSQGQLKIWPLRHPHCKETQGLLVKLEQPTGTYGHQQVPTDTGRQKARQDGYLMGRVLKHTSLLGGEWGLDGSLLLESVPSLSRPCFLSQGGRPPRCHHQSHLGLHCLQA